MISESMLRMDFFQDMLKSRSPRKIRSLLGEKQWEVVQAAVQWGYYNDPKGVSMRQMAERLNMARSTL